MLGFWGVVFWLAPLAAAIWALIILYRFAKNVEDVIRRLERIEKMVGQSRAETVLNQ